MNIINTYGFNEFFTKQLTDENTLKGQLIPAKVTEVHKEQYQIISEFGEQRARLKSSLFYNGREVIYPTVGDFVLIQYNDCGDSTIHHVLKRKSLFSRMDSFNEVEQVVAANFDYVFIMTSLNHDFNIKRIERYLAQAWQSGGSPVIVLTKADLCDDDSGYREQLETIAFGIPILEISSHTKQGFEELSNYVQPGKTIVFLGSSGVGKSSLVNALAGQYRMDVNSIRDDDARGRHTTTYRQLILLENNAMLIDTPGMRELGLWGSEVGLEATFEDVNVLLGQCRFNNCEHKKEPGCAIRIAMETGTLTQDRWQRYLKLEKEIKRAENKERMKRLKNKSEQKNANKISKALQRPKVQAYLED